MIGALQRLPMQPCSWYDASVDPCRRKPMTPAVQQLLEAFEALSEADKHRAAVEILRRSSSAVAGDVPEAALVEAAEELFRALDAEEAANAQR